MNSANFVYAGNLNQNTTEEEVKEFFGTCGTVVSVRLVYDRDTNRSKGFGFITFSEDSEATDAISQLDKKSLGGREIRVTKVPG